MASPEVHHLFHNPIADHAFSNDKNTLAVARDNTVELYQRSGNKFALKDELKGHDKTVTGVDIAPNSGRIVTCSQGMPIMKPCILTADSLSWFL
jgi:actin related protein 2/3 complex subunit 1A/1B